MEKPVINYEVGEKSLDINSIILYENNVLASRWLNVLYFIIAILITVQNFNLITVQNKLFFNSAKLFDI